MKNTIRTLSLICLLLTCQHFVIATISLEISDPRGWSGIHEGKISEATLSVQPKGLFLQYDMTLVISAAHISLNPFDSLEVEYLFELPEGAIIYDSWLWIEDYISYGIIMDIDSATRIYEDIVDRRTDPSILFKRSATQYELRIFPITTSEARKIKISFLLPMDWNDKQVRGNLPLTNIRPFFNGTNISRIVKDDGNWQLPAIPEEPGIAFIADNDSMYGQHFFTTLSGVETGFNLTLAFPSPMTNGHYASYFPTATNEGIYQLAVQGSELLDSIPAQKVLILVDYDALNANDPRPLIKEVAKQYLSPQDSFNYMLNTYATGLQMASPNWLPAEPTILDAAFLPVSNPPSPNSNLQSLLAAGLQFMANNNNEGSIVLLSDNDAYIDPQSGENLYAALTSSPGLPVPVHIANYQHKDFEYQWVPADPWGGDYVKTGSDYLFNLLANRSGGSYLSLQQVRPMHVVLSQPFIAARGRFDLTDLYPQIQGGFSYDRYELAELTAQPMIHTAMLQTGKYYGSFPFNIDFFAIQQQQFMSLNFALNQNDMIPGDTLHRKAWSGMHIQSMENTFVSPAIRQQMVDHSISNRVLSTHTAFLCLEDTAHQGGQPNIEVPVVDLDPQVADEIQLSAAPNPFDGNVRISIQHPPQQIMKRLELNLFDLHGRKLYAFHLKNYPDQAGTFEIIWDGRNQQGQILPTGVYLLVLSGEGIHQNIRLMKR